MKFYLTTAFGLLILLACGNPKSSNQQDSNNESDTLSSTENLPPVETKSANTDYEPAFEGQTRAPGLQTKTPYEGVVVNDELSAPWGIEALPDGRLLISENRGNFRIFNPETAELSDEIKGIPEVDDKGQGGLLGLTLDPDFSNNRMIYWVFSEKVADGNHSAVAKGKLSDDETSIENPQVIYRSTPTYDGDKHFGGRVLFDADGNLFVSIGERSDKGIREQAQNLNSTLGTIIRITKEGKPVAGNPFENDENALPEIYTYGHRNPQGIAIHPVTGELWSNEFGPRGGDELNLIKPGKNYGWPIITYGIEYSGETIGNPVIQQKEGMEQPVYYWDPVLSPSGMVFYTGNNIPEWENSLFITGLNSNHIARIVLENNRVVGEERILANEGQRFRDITQATDGALYTVTDEGRLYKLDKK